VPQIKPPEFSADQPLNDPADDRLCRDRFSEEIARSIAAWSGRESFVLSLTGEWGSGKSTIKNFVIHYLGDKAHVLEFNPWQWSGQDKLIEVFLWQLGALFGKDDVAKKTKKLASRWKAYASMVKVGGVLSAPTQTIIASLFSLSTVTILIGVWLLLKASLWVTLLVVALLIVIISLSFVGRLITRISMALNDWAISRERSLEELRSDIDQELRKLDKPVVVFVDDIDRLTDSEIKLLVQLVKANAQFPNLVFFLLFQKNIVTKALSAITSDDGAKYLSKIVQIEFAVPAASEKELQRIMGEGLDRIITRNNVTIR
jgi:predicted KAP-like P-loop ATPase